MRLKDAAAGTAKLPPRQKATPRRCGHEAKQERRVMLKSVYAVAAAAIVAGAFVATLSVSGRSRPAVRCRISRADRADIRPLARDCSQNAWPYFEAACLRDTRNPFGQARGAHRFTGSVNLVH